jgi:hypothetical protein
MEKKEICIQELNAIYGEFINSYSSPIKIDMSAGITVVPEDNFGAFELNPPNSKNIKLEKYKNGGVLVRYAFGYDFAAKTFKDYHSAIRFLSIVQNEMLLAISPWVDWSKDPKNLFKLPGKSNSYFLELQSSAGFEIRAYYDGSN